VRKIVVISNDRLTITASLGGAVENLVNILVNKNESIGAFKFVLFSTYSKESEILSSEKKEFIYINTDSLCYRLKKYCRFLFNRMTFFRIENQYLHEVKQKLQHIEDIDIILIENEPRYLLFLDDYYDKKIILHLHNDYVTNNVKYNDEIFSKANLILTVSNYLKNKIIKYTTVDLNVQVLHNGIDINRFSRIKKVDEIQNLKSIYKIHENDFVIAYAGRLQQDKGVELVIDSFINFNQLHESKLILIGASEFANKKSDLFAQRIFNKAKLNSHNIIFTNYVEYSKIHLYFQLANVFVLPSLCEEAFGLTVLEALASSKPVIVTDAGGIPEVVSEDCSIILQRDDKLIDNLVKSLVNLYEDKNYRQSLSNNARIRSLMFTDNLFFENFSRFINSI
jgi:spore coat protein SA